MATDETTTTGATANDNGPSADTTALRQEAEQTAKDAGAEVVNVGDHALKNLEGKFVLYAKKSGLYVKGETEKLLAWVAKEL